VRIRVSVAVICAALCVAGGAGLAFASGSDPSHTLPFSGGCGHRNPPKLAPHLLGARAQITVPRAWNAVRGLTQNGAGTTCAQEYLLINPPGEIGRLCEQDQVYAETGAGPQTPASPRFHSGFAVLGHGALPTVAGMQGSWEELDVGASEAAYQVTAGYEATDHRLFYELIVVPPPSYPGICRDSGPQTRAIARQLARSFRVVVTSPSTAEALS
jgi:hypothetical protein